MALDKAIDSAAHYAEIKTIADAVRKKGGTTALFNSAAEMAAAVEAIPERKPEQEKTAEAVTNGPVVLTADPGKAMSKATVNVKVPSDQKPEVKGAETIRQNGQQKFTPPAGSVYSEFSVNVQTPEPKPEQAYNRTYTSNGEYPIQPSPGQVISGGSIKVQTPVPKQEEAKAVEIKTNGTTVVNPTPGKVMNQVTIKTSTPAPKPEQVKEISISENGDFEIPADIGKVLSKAIAHVAVPTGGGGDSGGGDFGPFTKVKIRTITQSKKETSIKLVSDELTANYIACLKSKSRYEEYEVQNFLIRFLHTGGVDKFDEAFSTVNAYEQTKKGDVMYPTNALYSNGSIVIRSPPGSFNKPTPTFMAGETYYLIFLW